MSVGPHAEKFNIFSYSHGCTQRCDFSVLDGKFGPKNQNC